MKEVWRVRKPLRKIIHTMGWPLRTSASFGEFGGSFIYPMGDDLVTVGFVAGLEATDVEFSVHDVLQEFKTHRLVWKILGGGERVAWGAKTITEGGYYSLPCGSTRPWPAAGRRGGGARQRAAAEGRPLRDRVGPARRGGGVPCAPARRGAEPHRALDSYDESLRASPYLKELYEVRNMRQAFDKGFFVGGALASMMTVTKGRAPNGRFPTHPNAAAPLKKTGRASRYPAPDGSYIFDKLSSVFASGNRTRDDQPNHLKLRTTVRRPVAEAWQWMCPRTCTRSAATWATGW